MDLSFLSRKDVRLFIKNHLDEDVGKLLLNPPNEFRENIKIIAEQILARQKAKGKLDDWVANPDLIFPPPLSVEQSSSIETAKYKAELFRGESLVDLTGGMGIDALNLAEHFDSVTYNEITTELAEIFKHNADVLDYDIDVASLDALQFVNQLDSEKQHFFIDPARRSHGNRKVFKLEDCTPDLNNLLPQLYEKAEKVLLKLSPLIDIKSLFQQIKFIKEVHVVSVKNDCKEILVLIVPGYEKESRIVTVNNGADSTFDFYYSEEQKADVSYWGPESYILEPNASILKAGAFKKIALDFGVTKLSSNTHLYTTASPPGGWPGKIYKIVEPHFNKKLLDQYAPKKQINVITRNHPLKPDEIKKKFKVKDGGDYFLICFRDMKNKPRMVVAERC